MKVTLVVVEGKPLGLEIPLKGAKFSIGRDSRCNLRPNSDLVSKLHCLFEVQEQKLLVRDLGSTNGTFVNDEKIEGVRELSDGDRVRVGTLTFQARIAAPKQVAASNGVGKVERPLDDDPMEWLLADDDGKLIESGAGTTVIDLPVAGHDETVHESPAPEDAVAESTRPEPMTSTLNKTPKEPPKPPSNESRDTRSAANDILNRYLVRRRT